MGVERAITEQELLENLGWVRRLARRLAGDAGDDLAQQVCVAALDGGRIAPTPGAVSASPRVRAWLARVTAHLAGNHVRTESRRHERERAKARLDRQPSALDVVARNALFGQVVRAVDQLAEPYRTTVLLRYLDEVPNRELAAHFGVSEVVIRKRLSRGLAQLRARLSDRGVDRRSLSALFGLPSLHTAATAVPAAAVPTLGAMTMATTLTKTIAGATVAVGATCVLYMSGGPGAAPIEPASAPTPAVAGSDVDPLPPAPEMQTQELVAARPALPTSDTSKRREVPPAPQAAASAPTDRTGIELALMQSERNLEETMVRLDLLAAFEGQLAGEHLPADGYRLESYDDGGRRAAGYIVSGHRDGMWEEWHESGELAARGAYFAGMRHGAWVFWNTEGVEIRRGEFLYDNAEGPFERLEGELKTLSQYRNGELHGLLRQTRSSGSLALQESWFLGKRHGDARSFHANGAPESEGSYVHGTKTGEWSYWDPNGELDEERSGTVEPQHRLSEVRSDRKAVEAHMQKLVEQLKADRVRLDDR